MNTRNDLRRPVMNTLRLATAVLIVPWVLTACAGRGEDASAQAIYEAFPPGETQRSIDVRQIRRIEPVGNHTLLFYTGRGDVWRNRLRAPCPGLHRHSKFLYEPRQGRLSSLDTVYILIDEGFGFRRGAGCALGEFDYLTEEQAEALRAMR